MRFVQIQKADECYGLLYEIFLPAGKKIEGILIFY